MQDVAVLFVQDAMRRENRRRDIFSLIAISENIRGDNLARVCVGDQSSTFREKRGILNLLGRV